MPARRPGAALANARAGCLGTLFSIALYAGRAQYPVIRWHFDRQVAQDGTVAIENLITTYQKNALGQPDDSYLEVETLFTLAYVLRRSKAVITSKYARVKLAANGTRFAPGSDIVTPNIIRADLIAQYRQLESEGVVQNADIFKKAPIVEQNAQNPNRLDVLWPGTLVNPLRIFALLAQFRLN